MFTGLIETIGTVREVVPRRGSARLTIASTLPVREMSEGESVAVDGVCLTVSRRAGDRFSTDVVAETLSRTTLAKTRPGARVNLERALRFGDRLGGHLVQGHVDAVAKVREVLRQGDDYRLRVDLSPQLARFVAEKGSVAVHGVSLTVSAVTAAAFEVALVPETLARTTLGKKRVGDAVNVEIDLLARYLERLSCGDPADGGGWAGS